MRINGKLFEFWCRHFISLSSAFKLICFINYRTMERIWIIKRRRESLWRTDIGLAVPTSDCHKSLWLATRTQWGVVKCDYFMVLVRIYACNWLRSPFNMQKGFSNENKSWFFVMQCLEILHKDVFVLSGTAGSTHSPTHSNVRFRRGRNNRLGQCRRNLTFHYHWFMLFRLPRCSLWPKIALCRRTKARNSDLHLVIKKHHFLHTLRNRLR